MSSDFFIGRSPGTAADSLNHCAHDVVATLKQRQ